MNIIFLVPTGYGAEIGGHAGDATPAARLLAAICDNIILHPNVVNASDINEMPENSLYVTGSTIDDLARGYIGLSAVWQNRIAVLVNKPVPNEIVNLVSAARATLGINAFIVELPEPIILIASFDPTGRATGVVSGGVEATEHLRRLGEPFDAVGVISPIEVPKEIALNYLKEGGVNPWGGVEAKLTRILTDTLAVPCAHAPFGETLKDYNEIVDPRVAAEVISLTYAFCLLKGLNKAPEITDGSYGITVRDIDAVVTPKGCLNMPCSELLERGIPVIVVENNRTIEEEPPNQKHIVVQNYLEAAGVLLAIREGLTLESVSRPLPPTTIIRSES